MAALLDGLGEDYDIVEGGKDAIAAVERQDYDAVLMDMQMPDIDGEQAARAIRALPGRAETPPIIAVTAKTKDEDPLTPGLIDGFVGKPIDSAEVARALYEARARRPAEGAADAIGDPAVNAVFSKLVSTLGRDQTVSLYHEFARDARRRIGRMNAASGRNETEALRRDAHDLKSTAGNFGFKELSDLGGAIETACRNGDSARAATLLSEIGEPAERALSAIAPLNVEPVSEDPEG